jgi:glycosyltransferase involved in cell wall biosynthesis
MFSHVHSLLLASACTTAVVVRPEFVEALSWWYRWLTKNIDFNFIEGAASLPHSKISELSRVRLRDNLSRGSERVVTYFGFATRNKGLEQLFRIADPRRDRLILVCDLLESDAYQREILALCDSEAWRGKVTVTGFLPAQEVSDILSASDAVVLPFTDGGGDWNSTIMAVRAQGTLVITTSFKRGGYEEASNTFYSKPEDLEAMANAITLYGGRKSDLFDTVTDAWSEIAELHVKIYERILNKKTEAVA